MRNKSKNSFLKKLFDVNNKKVLPFGGPRQIHNFDVINVDMIADDPPEEEKINKKNKKKNKKNRK
ncbi:MAG: hypothetical protein ACP5N7_05345 [Candidatus Pacearchaeota archaeon]